MTATFGAISRVAYASRTNTTVNVPASTTDGMLLLLCHVTANTGTAVSATLPAGFTSIGTAQTGSDGSFGMRVQHAWRIASSEPASYTLTHATCNSECWLMRIGGTNTLSVDVASANQGTGTGGITNASATSVTPTVANDLLIYSALNWNIANLTEPSGMTEQQDAAFLYIATQALGAVAATGAKTQSYSGNNPWFADLIAIKDVAATGKPVKVWSGSAWVTKTLKVWSGSAWVTKPAKVWNGSAWV